MTRPADEPGIDPYKVLQVDPEAEPEILQAADRRLAQKYHPDVMPRPEGKARMTAINAAWEIVGDPNRRAAHDRERARREAAGAAEAHEAKTAATGQAGPSRAPTARSRPDPAGRPRPPAPAPACAPRPSRATGRAGARRPAVATIRPGCGPPMARSRRPATRKPVRGVLNFGRYAGWSLGRSPGPTSSTSNG